MSTPYYHNKDANAFVAPVASDERESPLEFHRRLPGYATTPLVEAKSLARQLGIGKLWVKDESSRIGLPSFKILGASWAMYKALGRLPGVRGIQLRSWENIAELSGHVASLRPLTLVAATDGNHGRAVARMAALLGLEAQIFVPDDMAPARCNAIAAEGARVVPVQGSYDDAVRLSAQAVATGTKTLVISDTSWPGYEQTPLDVIAGYSTIFREIDAELARRGEDGPDLVMVQMGVGALAAAVVQHYRRAGIKRRPMIAGVEPVGADCLLQSMLAGRITEVPGPHRSIMAGLNCGLPSHVAWPLVSQGIDLFLAIEDERSRQAMRALARERITAGETGAAGVGGLIELLRGEQAESFRPLLGIGETTKVLAISTEGATDPASYEAILVDS